jgi:hypothetical protein
MKNVLIISLLALGGFVISSCSKDEPCMDETNVDCLNFNPCSLKEPMPTINFDIYQTYAATGAPEFKTDTLNPGTIGYFVANIKNAIRYEWRLGIDTFITTEPTFSIGFNRADSTFLENNPVEVTLIVEYHQPDTICFPDNDGRDTITKVIYFRQLWQSAYLGRWEVYLNGDTENPYEIEIKLVQTPPFPSLEMQIINLYNEGVECLQDAQDGYYGYSEFKTEPFYFMHGCGNRNYDYSTSIMKGKVDLINEILYLEWKGGYRPSQGSFIYDIPYSLVGYKID